ncbi:MAG: rRNA maturation RNase YbeY [Campylobacterota bacterium]|nr:rRNA maturation RNase YbeY [Campylobacterota bacterium]
MISLDNQTNYTIETVLLEKILATLTSQEVELTLCDNATIATLNATHRDKDKPTDVLSFPLVSDFDFMPLGNLVISLEMAQEVANELGHSVEDEIALLFIHGTLHLLGYDHESDEGQMRTKEIELIEHFELPRSLIVRTQEE